MKMRSSAITLAITLGLASSVLASDKTKNQVDTKDKKAKPEQTATPEREKVALTGSYIKQDIRRNGRITDGPSQVVVLDHDAIERSGAGDLKQLLIRQGIH
jgi:hypothetical protein